MNTDTLQNIKETIENMNKSYQIEVLKLLTKEESINISENNNGTFINLTNMDSSVIKKLQVYIDYVNKQQNQLLFVEEEKANIKNEFFKKEKKQSNIKNSNIAEMS